MRSFSLSALLLAIAAPVLAQAKAAPKPAALTWGPAPAVFPAGAQMAVVSGDPSKAGPFVVQLKLPAGYHIPPHFHPTDETVEVKEGILLYAMGDTFDLQKMTPMKVGAKGTIPALTHHFAGAQVATLVQISSVGPFAMNFVNPADDPQKQAPKP